MYEVVKLVAYRDVLHVHNAFIEHCDFIFVLCLHVRSQRNFLSYRDQDLAWTD